MFKINDRVVWTDPLDNEEFRGTVTFIDATHNRVSVKWDLGGTERMNPQALRRDEFWMDWREKWQKNFTLTQ